MLDNLIQNSFLLTEKQKIYYKKIISKKDDNFIQQFKKLLETEKIFLLKSLKEYKNRNTNIWIIKQELIQKNLKRIKLLEQEDEINYDLDKELENTF